MRAPGCLISAMALALPLAAQQPPTPPAADSAVVAAVAIPAAERVAQDWLHLLDNGQYRATFETAARSFQQAMSEDGWEDAVTRARGPFGTFGPRSTYQPPRLLHDPKGMPPGDYLIFRYRTRVTSGGTTVIETVSTERESDGSWRVDGYFVAPDA